MCLSAKHKHIHRHEVFSEPGVGIYLQGCIIVLHMLACDSRVRVYSQLVVEASRVAGRVTLFTFG